MGTTHATRNGQFKFTDPADEQVSIPLSALQFPSGTLSADATKWATLTVSHDGAECGNQVKHQEKVADGKDSMT